jgi:hypothetical protein
MNRPTVDPSMDGLPMDTVIDPAPTSQPMHDQAVNDGPTTVHGPLANQPESLNDRLITAQFATAAAADSARHALLSAGIPDSSVRIIAHAAESPAVKADIKPADDTLIGRIREAILPDEASAGQRVAVAQDNALLNVTPSRDQVETVVRILQASHPVRFDADLERWRNKG